MTKALETPCHAGKTGRIPKPHIFKRDGAWYYRTHYSPKGIAVVGTFPAVRKICFWF